MGDAGPGRRSRRAAATPSLTDDDGRNLGSWTPWKDGRHRYQVVIPGRGRRAFYGKTQAEAFLKAKAVYDAARSAATPLSDKDVAALVAEWMAAHEPRPTREGRYATWKPVTYETNEGYCRRHILPALGTVKVQRLSVELLDKMLQAKIGTMSESTRDHLRNILGQICEWAVARDVIPKNYAKYTAPITVPTYKAIILTPEQCGRLIEAAWAHPLGGVVIVGILTGMREGEILGLEWSKVADGWLTVDTTLTHVSRASAERFGIRPGLQTSPTNKTDNPREQPVVEPIARVLEMRRAMQAKEKLLAAHWVWKDTDFIFTTSVGTAVSKSNFLTRTWHPMLALASLPKMHFHDLRHSHASLLRELGYDLKDAGAMLGQTEVRTTSGYTQVSRDRKQGIAEHVVR
ncbi:MAG: tyrosine-type recombinase/integrase, partial [Candidatus Dormibacteria bacterium]